MTFALSTSKNTRTSSNHCSKDSHPKRGKKRGRGQYYRVAGKVLKWDTKAGRGGPLLTSVGEVRCVAKAHSCCRVTSCNLSFNIRYSDMVMKKWGSGCQ